MANLKIVGADQLDADLTAVADAIRGRAGTTEKLVFPEGFESAVEGIPDYLQMKVSDQTCEEYRNEKLITTANNAFQGWKGLKSVYLPNLETVANYCFQGCGGVSEFVFQKVKTVGSSAFAYSTGFSKADFHCVTSIGNNAFEYANKLTALIIRTDSVCALGNVNAFNNTLIKSGTGYIYVPKALVDSYKAATNWSAYASQIRAIEDYPDITGG